MTAKVFKADLPQTITRLEIFNILNWLMEIMIYGQLEIDNINL